MVCLLLEHVRVHIRQLAKLTLLHLYKFPIQVCRLRKQLTLLVLILILANDILVNRKDLEKLLHVLRSRLAE